MLLLNELYLINASTNIKLILGILHILSHLKYETIKPIGPTIAVAAINHKDIEVRECGIRAFESWGNSHSLSVLKSLKKSGEEWLDEYVAYVIHDLEEEINHVFTR